MKILETYINNKELLESGKIHEYASNFGYEHLVNREIKGWEEFNPTFYLVEADSRINYGLDFKVYASYKADGINFLKQFDFHHSLTSHGLVRVMFVSNGDDTHIQFGTTGYDKSQSNRKALREYSKAGWIFN